MKIRKIQYLSAFLLTAVLLASGGVASAVEISEPGEEQYTAVLGDPICLDPYSPEFDGEFMYQPESQQLFAEQTTVPGTQPWDWINRPSLQENTRQFYQGLVTLTRDGGALAKSATYQVPLETDNIRDVEVGGLLRLNVQIGMENGSTATVGGVGVLAWKGMAQNSPDIQEILTAVYAFYADHPEVFWFYRDFRTMYLTEGNQQALVLLEYLYDTDNQELIWDSRETVYSGFIAQPADIETDIRVRNQCVEVARSYEKPAATPVEQVALYNEYLSNICGYTTGDLNDPWAHCCLSALTGGSGTNGPVCEGYAEAFKVLCDQAGIPCVSVMGKAGEGQNKEPHQWNYVSLDSGKKWYAVDVTWNDPAGTDFSLSGRENVDYFLSGKNTVAYSGALPFIKSHPQENDISAEAQYNVFSGGPELEEQGYFAGKIPEIMPILYEDGSQDQQFHQLVYDTVTLHAPHKWRETGNHENGIQWKCSNCNGEQQTGENHVERWRSNREGEVVLEGIICDANKTPSKMLLACYDADGRMLAVKDPVIMNIEPMEFRPDGFYRYGTFRVEFQMPEFYQSERFWLFFLDENLVPQSAPY